MFRRRQIHSKSAAAKRSGTKNRVTTAQAALPEVTAPAARPDQNLYTQLDALHKAGCDEIFQDKITGISTSRPALDTLLTQSRPGDTMMTVGRCHSPFVSIRSKPGSFN